jgi:aryl-alcohol dehydrogenase-like predicted oxidoreductase
MEYLKLGATDIEVSRLCLGTVFRAEGPEAACLATIERAADLGCNFLDCANVYRDGFSEQVVGKAVKGRRNKFIITSKVGAATVEGVNNGGLSRRTIMRDVEASLKRLGTDYIDFYLCHFPDPNTPLDETLRAMDDLVRQGKIRHPGCSNFPAWQLCEALRLSSESNCASFACNQVQWSLLDRRIEEELIPLCTSKNVAITVFAVTFIGLLSGRYRYGQPPPPGTPWEKGPYNYRAAMTRATDRVIQTIIEVAQQRGKTAVQVAIAWCLTRPQITSVIIGADVPEQVEEDFGALGWKLADDELSRLNDVSEGMRMTVYKDAPDGYRQDDCWPK